MAASVRCSPTSAIARPRSVAQVQPAADEDRGQQHGCGPACSRGLLEGVGSEREGQWRAGGGEGGVWKSSSDSAVQKSSCSAMLKCDSVGERSVCSSPNVPATSRPFSSAHKNGDRFWVGVNDPVFLYAVLRIQVELERPIALGSGG